MFWFDIHRLCVFESPQSRSERDPLIIAKMLAVGRQCLLDTQYKFDMAEVSVLLLVHVRSDLSVSSLKNQM